MIMQQNINHIHQYNNFIMNRNDCIVDNNVVGCNWFPVSDLMTDIQSIENCVDPPEIHTTGHVDIDSYINLQFEKLRKMVQEKRRIELSQLITRFETRTLTLMNQKDEQIQQQLHHIMQLQSLSSTLQLENESLHNMTRQDQVTIESLNQTILQLHELKNHIVDDVESCCDVADVTLGRVSSEGLSVICGRCELKEANVVFLPCRHLCVCDVCESEVDVCPFCKGDRSSSIMTLVF